MSDFNQGLTFRGNLLITGTHKSGKTFFLKEQQELSFIWNYVLIGVRR